MNKNTRSMVIWWVVVAGLVVLGIYQLFNRRDPVYQLATSDFHQYITRGPDLFDGYLVLDEEWIEGKFHESVLNDIRADVIQSVRPEEQENPLPQKWQGEFRASRDAIDDYDIQAKLDQFRYSLQCETPI